jgi:hypothetical protein
MGSWFQNDGMGIPDTCLESVDTSIAVRKYNLPRISSQPVGSRASSSNCTDLEGDGKALVEALLMQTERIKVKSVDEIS